MSKYFESNICKTGSEQLVTQISICGYANTNLSK